MDFSSEKDGLEVKAGVCVEEAAVVVTAAASGGANGDGRSEAYGLGRCCGGCCVDL